MHQSPDTTGTLLVSFVPLTTTTTICCYVSWKIPVQFLEPNSYTWPGSDLCSVKVKGSVEKRMSALIALKVKKCLCWLTRHYGWISTVYAFNCWNSALLPCNRNTFLTLDLYRLLKHISSFSSGPFKLTARNAHQFHVVSYWVFKVLLPLISLLTKLSADAHNQHFHHYTEIELKVGVGGRTVSWDYGILQHSEERLGVQEYNYDNCYRNIKQWYWCWVWPHTSSVGRLIPSREGTLSRSHICHAISSGPHRCNDWTPGWQTVPISVPGSYTSHDSVAVMEIQIIHYQSWYIQMQIWAFFFCTHTFQFSLSQHPLFIALSTFELMNLSMRELYYFNIISWLYRKPGELGFQLWQPAHKLDEH